MTKSMCSPAFVCPRAQVGIAICAVLTGCGGTVDPGAPSTLGEDATDGSTTDPGASATADASASGAGGDADGTAGDGMATDGGMATDDAGTGDLPPGMEVCGDGLVQGAEECDDGLNDGGYGGCNANCTLAAFCGDGTLNGASEDCDDGDVDSSDGCLADCSIPASCEDIKLFDLDADDGNYIIDPDGPLGEVPELVYCDMTVLAVDWSDVFEIPGDFGHHTGGGGVAIGEIGAGLGPDMIIFHIEDDMTPTQGYYQIAWNLDDTGQPTLGWSDLRMLPTIPQTEDAEGGGIALADVNANGVLDLIVLHVDDPSGPNQAYYRVGFDLDQNGNVAGGWTELFEITGQLDSDTDGGGIAVADLNGNDALDLIVLHVEDPDGDARGLTQIGWDLDTNGEVAIWAPPALMPGSFGVSNQGAGLEVFEATNGQALLATNYEDPSGENPAFSRVGRQLDGAGGLAGGWSVPEPIPGSFGYDTGFGGVATWDLGGNGRLDVVHFYIDERSGTNPGFYRWAYGG
ncbi:MAG: hypothetical protein K0V04_09470 [Deltaproteobacteria bacterium]|nr:hypothetical protein [Deltaproteobacteria bacterium]